MSASLTGDVEKSMLPSSFGEGIKRWVPDVVPHTYASYAYQKWGQSIAKVMGHSRPEMLHTFYKGLVTPSQAEAYWVLKPNAKDGITSSAATD